MVNTNKLKAAIAKNGLTQRAVAEKLLLSTQSLNAKINNKTEFTVAEAYKLCGVLKIKQAEMVEIFFAKKLD